MKATAHIVHSVHGRTRFRVRHRRHDRLFFREVETRLARVPEVTNVSADPLTGSVLVHHEGSTLDLIMAAVSCGVDELVELAEVPPPVADLIRGEVASLDRRLQSGTGGQFDLSTIAAFGLFALAGIQLVQGAQPLLAVSFAWYASELLRRWEAPSAATSG